MEQIRHVPGAVDFRMQEPTDLPQFNVKIDRSLASIVGVNAQAITQSVLGALSGSQQVSPNFWVDPSNRVSYQINTQAPQYDLHSLDDLRNLPILGGSSGQAQIVANVASISRTTSSPVEDHYNIRPVINIYGGADGKDLGYVSDQIQKLVDASRKDLPRGSFISVRGQVTTMHDSYTGLYVGLAFSMLLTYLLVDGGQFPILDTAVYHYHGTAFRAYGNYLDAVRNGHNLERTGSHGCNHVYGGSHGQQRSGGHFCQ
jgi:multidrug efflux pump subunit AcrB